MIKLHFFDKEKSKNTSNLSLEEYCNENKATTKCMGERAYLIHVRNRALISALFVLFSHYFCVFSSFSSQKKIQKKTKSFRQKQKKRLKLLYFRTISILSLAKNAVVTNRQIKRSEKNATIC